MKIIKIGGSGVPDFYIMMMTLASLFLLGCQSTKNNGEKSQASGQQVERGQMQVDLKVQGANATQGADNKITLDYPVVKERNDLLPDWVINPGIDGVLGAVGVGPKGKLGTKEQLDEARLNARLEIAQMLELRLQGVDRSQLEQQVQSMSTGLQDNSRKNLLAIDRSIADIVLTGSRQRALWFDPDTDECYIWMVLDGRVLDQVDHYVSREVSVFVANTPIMVEYKPQRRKDVPPTVIVQIPDQKSAPAAPPKEKTNVEELEGKLKDIETIPLERKESGAGDKSKEK